MEKPEQIVAGMSEAQKTWVKDMPLQRKRIWPDDSVYQACRAWDDIPEPYVEIEGKMVFFGTASFHALTTIREELNSLGHQVRNLLIEGE